MTSIAKVRRDIAPFQQATRKYDRIRTEEKPNMARTPEIGVGERRQIPCNPGRNREMASIAKVCRCTASFVPDTPEYGSGRKEDESNTDRTPGVGIEAGRQIHGNPAHGASTPYRNSAPLYGHKSKSVGIGISRMNSRRHAIAKVRRCTGPPPPRTRYPRIRKWQEGRRI